jgi:transposase
VLAQAGQPPGFNSTRASLVDPFVSLIEQTLEKYPTLRASRLYAMARERGYTGGPDHFRHVVARYRPAPAAEAYLRLRTLPGEQAQVDWGYFGKRRSGRAERALWGFVMVLSYSRQIFLRFFFGNAMANFLRGHVAAFASFGGIPRVLLYDNLKSAVLERVGQAIHFNPTLGQREGPRRACHSLHPRQLLCRPPVHRSRRPQRPGHGVVRGHRRRASVSRRPHPARARGVGRRP